MSRMRSEKDDDINIINNISGNGMSRIRIEKDDDISISNNILRNGMSRMRRIRRMMILL